MDHWESAFKRVIDELAKMREVMDMTSTGYRGAEEGAAAGAHSFASALVRKTTSIPQQGAMDEQQRTRKIARA
jgi:hypothetical protein